MMNAAADLAEDNALKEIATWFEHGLGHELLAFEQRILDRLLAGLYGVHLAQIGVNPLHPLADASTITHKFVIYPELTLGMGPESLVADATEMPLNQNSVDVVLLHHTLDFSASPHQVVREAARVVRPGGYILVVGFNPASLWGVMKWRACQQHAQVWRRAQFISQRRLHDWIQLLGLTTVRTLTDYYQPPYVSDTWRGRFAGLNRLGRRSLPGCGAFYATLVRKDVASMTPIAPKRRTRRFIQLPVPEPATRGQISETR
ncbi:class I SAM-dependent methyltransferase [Neptunomonas marina]|uniref:SAM-dependent methyltransferase n=1 Tax=Neptunomonas marina TaxID=1815562 RepID=A0A437Q189_9GAMM|nr:class I SAM-dependent methyltransferase [Neptunomonas marina]RVU28288.1 SAM-dependent methyltransferase [Neptunomonas marina]